MMEGASAMDDGCKLSMLLNWYTLNSCFLTSSFHVRSKFTFFIVCFLAFLLVIVLEFSRRLQRAFDRYLLDKRAVRYGKNSQNEEIEMKLLAEDQGARLQVKENPKVFSQIMLEQFVRGMIHMVQFAISYCIMLMFMYSNGYVIISILLGAVVGFALFTRDTLDSRTRGREIRGRDDHC